jgi:hypothetical protein
MAAGKTLSTRLEKEDACLPKGELRQQLVGHLADGLAFKLPFLGST